MAQLTMYVGQVGSPPTTLSSGINASVTTIPVTNATVLPDGPNLASIGSGGTVEVILYTGKSANDLTGVTRGFGGSSAATWISGTPISRLFTTFDHNTFRSNILDIVSQIGAASGIASLDSNSRVEQEPKVHQLINTTHHPASGLTAGHFLKATGTGTYTFGAHGLTEEIRIATATEFRFEVRTSDPVSPAVGRAWFRSDL